jgi:hypothetical protein
MVIPRAIILSQIDWLLYSADVKFGNSFERYDINLTVIGLTPVGSSTAHIYTQTIHRIQRKEHT